MGIRNLAFKLEMRIKRAVFMSTIIWIKMISQKALDKINRNYTICINSILIIFMIKTALNKTYIK